MGWEFANHWLTKEDMIASIKEAYNTNGVTIREFANKGRALWAVLEKDDTGEFVIMCYLTKKLKGNMWGYKVMGEDVGPCYYTVPLSWLEEYPTTNKYALKWRKEVLKERNKPKITFDVGTVIDLGDHRYEITEKVKRSYHMTRVGDGSIWKLGPSQFGHVVVVK